MNQFKGDSELEFPENASGIAAVGPGTMMTINHFHGNQHCDSVTLQEVCLPKKWESRG